METLTVADLAALLTAMQSVPRMRGQAATKEKLLSALREAMEAQPAHADQQKVSMIFSACGKSWRRIPQKDKPPRGRLAFSVSPGCHRLATCKRACKHMKTSRIQQRTLDRIDRANAESLTSLHNVTTSLSSWRGCELGMIFLIIGFLFKLTC